MKYQVDIYGVRINNLKRKLTSKRISVKRLKIIHRPLNKLKRKFRRINRKFFAKYHNTHDILTLEDISTIPKIDSVELSLKNDKKVITSASKMLNWIVQKDYLEYPKNPYTNVDFGNDAITQIINIAKNYYLNNPFFKKNYETDERVKEKNNLYKNLTNCIFCHCIRLNPEKGLELFDNVLNNIYEHMDDILFYWNIYPHSIYYSREYNFLLYKYKFYLEKRNMLASNINSEYYMLH